MQYCYHAPPLTELLTTACHPHPYPVFFLPTRQDADKFVKMVEVYVRGNSIKYVTIPDEVLDMVQEEDLSKESESQ